MHARFSFESRYVIFTNFINKKRESWFTYVTITDVIATNQYRSCVCVCVCALCVCVETGVCLMSRCIVAINLIRKYTNKHKNNNKTIHAYMDRQQTKQISDFRAYPFRSSRSNEGMLSVMLTDISFINS